MVEITQKMSDFTAGNNKRKKKKHHGFDFWLYEVRLRDRLPRGKFFIGKKAKFRPIFDEWGCYGVDFTPISSARGTFNPTVKEDVESKSDMIFLQPSDGATPDLFNDSEDLVTRHSLVISSGRDGSNHGELGTSQ